MIDHAVRYLKQHSASFRLVSHPVAEPLPAVAQRPPPNGQMVDTHVVVVDAVPALACVPAGEPLDVVVFGQEIQGLVIEGSARDLPAPFNDANHIPPLGGLIGVPVFLDRRVAPAVIVFRAFGREDFIEVLFDDYARIEGPRVITIAVAGALPETGTGDDVPVIPATDATVAGRGAPTPPPMAERASGMVVPIDEERTRLAPPEPPAHRGEKRSSHRPKHAPARVKPSPAPARSTHEPRAAHATSGVRGPR